MRKLLVLLLLVPGFCFAQSAVIPYNPDANSDGWISVNDLLALLSLFETEFSPDQWQTDSLSAAIVVEGDFEYFQCQNACSQIEGGWRMADLDAWGKHFSLSQNASSTSWFWINSNEQIANGAEEILRARNSGELTSSSINYSTSELSAKCLCHLRSSPFVPDVLTSETTGIQEQIDSLETHYNQLLATVQALDSAQTSFVTDSVICPSVSQYSLECVEMGWSPLCPVGVGIEDYVTLGPSESGDWGSGLQYNFRGDGYLSDDNLRMNPKWRKFKVNGPIPEGTPHAIIRRTDNSLSGATYAIDLFNEDGEWFFYAFDYGTNCSNCCAYGPPIDLPDGEHLSMGAGNWEYSIQIFIPADGFYIDTGIGAVFKRY